MTSTARRARPARLCRAALVALCLALVAAPAAVPERADAHGSAPYHEAGQTMCQAGRVLAYPPRVMRPTRPADWRNAQLVKWSPDLYRWQKRRWRLVDGSKPWNWAATSDAGYLQRPLDSAWHKPNNFGALFEPFDGLRSGIYAVKHYMYWADSGQTHAHWGAPCRA
jgi:hypothetical protein